jgi:LL-diaminopimelate aminotransferase
MEFSFRVRRLKPYFFEELDKLKKKYRDALIDMGVGDPDIPTPHEIVEILCKEAKNREYHRYSPYEGYNFLKKAVKFYYKKRFDVELEDDEILILIGSKEGLFHLAFVLLEKDRYSLCPDPAYPVYSIASYLAEGEVYYMPLVWENDFLPEFGRIDNNVLERASVMYLNYPNNPTGAEANLEFWKDAVNLAKKMNFVLVNDFCYAEIYEEEPPCSLLQISKRNCIEFNSLSKSFNMTGWRIAFVCGDREVIRNLARFKTVIDNCQFGAIQKAAEYALLNYEKLTDYSRKKYAERRKKLKKVLKEVNYKFFDTQSTFYIWVKTGSDGYEFSQKLLREKQILAAPGEGFGGQGKHYIRFSITIPDEKLDIAIKRLRET